MCVWRGVFGVRIRCLRTPPRVVSILGGGNKVPGEGIYGVGPHPDRWQGKDDLERERGSIYVVRREKLFKWKGVIDVKCETLFHSMYTYAHKHIYKHHPTILSEYQRLAGYTTNTHITRTEACMEAKTGVMHRRSVSKSAGKRCRQANTTRGQRKGSN